MPADLVGVEEITNNVCTTTLVTVLRLFPGLLEEAATQAHAMCSHETTTTWAACWRRMGAISSGYLSIAGDALAMADSGQAVELFKRFVSIESLQV